MRSEVSARTANLASSLKCLRNSLRDVRDAQLFLPISTDASVKGQFVETISVVEALAVRVTAMLEASAKADDPAPRCYICGRLDESERPRGSRLWVIFRRGGRANVVCYSDTKIAENECAAWTYCLLPRTVRS